MHTHDAQTFVFLLDTFLTQSKCFKRRDVHDANVSIDKIWFILLFMLYYLI